MSTQQDVRELAEKLKEGGITPKEAIQTLEEWGLTEKAVLRYGAWGYLIWLVPCFLPWVAKHFQLQALSFLADLPQIVFPPAVIYLAVALFVAALPLTAWGIRYNTRKGGCRNEDNTVVLLSSGPYAIVRHPSLVAWSVFFVTLPIFLSPVVPFTVLSVAGIVGIVAFHYYASVKEERELNTRKWGDAYREYMTQVPRWNVFKGLWNRMTRW
jgi:protein-S-isoprenylcysteine O-methyltransferase Ste14